VQNKKIAMETNEIVKTIEDYNYDIPRLPKIENAFWRGFEYRDEPLLEYVTKICDVIFIDIAPDEAHIDEDGISCVPEYLSWGPNRFATRYHDGKIDESVLGDYIENDELMWMLRAYRLDPAKFWYLILFLKDWADDITIDAAVFNKSIADELKGIATAIDQCHFSSTNHLLLVDADKACRLIIDVEGKKDKIFTNIGTMYVLRKMIADYLQKAESNQNLYNDLYSRGYAGTKETEESKSPWIASLTENLQLFLKNREADSAIKEYPAMVGKKMRNLPVPKSKFGLCSICISLLTGDERYDDSSGTLLKNNYRSAKEKLEKSNKVHSVYIN